MKLIGRLCVVGILAFVATSAAAQSAPVRVGGTIQAPQKIKDVAPVYPPIALTAHVQGVVILEITIGTDGTITDAAILRHIALLDDAALTAVRQWVFKPTLLNGVPVPVIMTATVNFTLLNPPATPPTLTAPQVSSVTASFPTATTATGRGSATPPTGRQPGVNQFLPRITHAVKPAYPPDVLTAGVTRTVSLDVTVDESGGVSDVVVTQSQPLLDVASLDAARQWKFVPSTLNGVPVSMHLAIDFIFSPEAGVQDTVRPIGAAAGASVTQAPPSPSNQGAPIRVGGDIKPPVKLVDVAPIYPADALQAGITGVVIMEITIGPDGRVTNATVLRRIPELERAALDAVKQWQFAPTIVNGVAVPIIMTVTVNFTR